MARRFPPSTPTTHARTPIRHVRLHLELLEDRSLLAAVAPELLVRFNDGTMQSVPLPPGVNVETAAAAWRAHSHVKGAELNQRITTTIIPSDVRFAQQWGMHNTGQAAGRNDADIDAPEAWDVGNFRGNTSKVVAVLDTGIDYTHPDLYKNVWVNQREIPASRRANLTDTDGDGKITFWDLNEPINIGPNKITDLNGNGRIDAGDILRPLAQGGWADGVDQDGSYGDDLIGYNFVTNTNNPFDDNSHGTHVSGTIGAMGNNTLGVSGVNWKTQLAAVKFLDAEGEGSLEGAILALNYAVAKGIPISNNSWGGGEYSRALYDAISAARSAGHVFVVAAGNVGVNNDQTPSYPSSYGLSNVVSVAATTRIDGLATFSNYGASTVDLGAPGEDILSTVPGNGYDVFSGTSMATPYVTGAVAYLWSKSPTSTPARVIAQILNNTDPLPALAGTTVSGGRLSLYKAMWHDRATPPADKQGPRIVALDTDHVQTPGSVRLTFNEPIDVGSFSFGDFLLRDPSGNAIDVWNVSAVPGSGEVQVDVTFAPQTAPGNYTLEVGPDVRDVAGNAMDQNLNGVNGEEGAAPYGDVYAGSFEVVAPPMDTTGAQVVKVEPIGTHSVSGLHVTFSEEMDPASFTVDDVAVFGPAGWITVTSVVPVNAGHTEFVVTFAELTTPGDYTYTNSAGILDAAGNPMDQNQNGVNGDSWDMYYKSFRVTAAPRQEFLNKSSQPIRDLQTTTSTIVITQAVTIADLNVRFNITHGYDGDLIISLRAPNGRVVTLVNRRGGSGNNFTNTLMDDAASKGIAAGSAPFAGSFRPESPLAAFNGLNAKGTWRLTVSDQARRETGSLNSWSLSIQTAGMKSGTEGRPGSAIENRPGGAVKKSSVEVSVPGATVVAATVVETREVATVPAAVATPAMVPVVTWLAEEPRQTRVDEETEPAREEVEVRVALEEPVRPAEVEPSVALSVAEEEQPERDEAFAEEWVEGIE